VAPAIRSSVARPDPADKFPPSSAPMVGRVEEIALLRAAVDEVRQGRGTTVLVSGEPGIGKTRLTQAVVEYAVSSGFTAAVGHAFPVEGGVPYAPWADALLPLVRSLEPAQLATLTRGGGAELAQIIPVLDTANVARRPEGDPLELKARVLWTAAQFLARMAGRSPMMIVLENLQWADDASIELLHFVARQSVGCKLLLLGTFSDADRARSDALRSTEHSLVALGCARAYRLTPLDAEDVAELLVTRFGSSSAELSAFAGKLHAWTRGNPFFLDQMLKSLMETGRLKQHEGLWTGWDAEALGVPRSVKETMLERILRLPQQALELAGLVAVIGTRAGHWVLEQTSGLSARDLLAALDELRRADILIESQDGDDVVYDFVHPMLRQTVAEELGLARARLLHGTVAEALERSYGEEALAHADELAFHYLRAGTTEHAPKTIGYLVTAGRGALNKSANREAATYLDAALRLMDEAQHTDEPARIAVLEELAEALDRGGEGDRARKLWEHARDMAAARSDHAAVARIARRLGLSSYWRGRHDEALTHYQAGLDAAREAQEDALYARLLLTRGMCFQDIGDTEQGERDACHALEIAEATGDRALLARAHRSLTLLYLLSGQGEKARRHGALTLELARETGQPTSAWAAHSSLAVLSGLTGDMETTAMHQSEAERLAEALQSPILRLRTAEMTVCFGYATGEWDRALTAGENAVALARAFGRRGLLARLLVWLGLIYMGRDDLPRAKQFVDEAWEMSGAGRSSERTRDVHALILAHIGIAQYHLTTGDFDRARSVAMEGLTIADRHGYVVWAVYRLVPILLESLLWTKRFDEAEHWWRRLRRDSEKISTRLGVTHADTGHALVDTLRGTTRDALLRVEETADLLEAVPYIFDAARLRREIARRWVELGDRDRALQSLRRAHDAFARLGAAGELRGTREQMRELGARPPSVSSGSGAAGLSSREVEIVQLVALRRSNKEIGQALGISSRTVSTHLSNIFTKTGVSSRGELADLARAKGLTGTTP
jgi:DNA-binding CsgD family transcriptional regulator